LHLCFIFLCVFICCSFTYVEMDSLCFLLFSYLFTYLFMSLHKGESCFGITSSTINRPADVGCTGATVLGLFLLVLARLDNRLSPRTLPHVGLSWQLHTNLSSPLEVCKEITTKQFVLGGVGTMFRFILHVLASQFSVLSLQFIFIDS
jgi:hypothetical protein